MGVRIPSTTSNTLLATSITTSELGFCGTPILSSSVDGGPVRVSWYTVIANAGGAQQVTVRLRRAPAPTISGVGGFPLLNQVVNLNLAASTTAIFSGCYIDASPPAAQSSYLLTLQMSSSVQALLDACVIAAMM